MGAEIAEPKGVKKAERVMLVAAVAVVQIAASSIRAGWVVGTKGQCEKDEGVREGQERLRVIMRMWLATVHGRKRANPWIECECRFKERWKQGRKCECAHASTAHILHTLGMEMGEGMVVGMWEGEGPGEDEGGMEEVGSRQPKEKRGKWGGDT